jgi:NitT/TauT family transport system substrate-binding protein
MQPAHLLRTLTAGLVLLGGSPASAETTLDKVSFGTDRPVGPEQGGFYQALVDGTYKSYGLDVSIVPGGLNIDNRALLISGKLDFYLSPSIQQALDAVARKVPVVAVAAIFQKDSEVLIAHPIAKVNRLQDVRPFTLFVSREGQAGYFQWLKSEYKFSESKIKPYATNLQPFLFDKKSAMEGHVTFEPFMIEKQGGFKPTVLLLAEDGFGAYSAVIETRRDAVDKKPDLLQRFVDASIVGWYHYLYGDNAAGNAMMQKLNPDLSDALLAYAVAKLKEHGIVDSGDAVRDGIGAMTDARVGSFFDTMSRTGALAKDIDFRKAYSLQFVNKGVGLDLRPRNLRQNKTPDAKASESGGAEPAH